MASHDDDVSSKEEKVNEWFQQLPRAKPTLVSHDAAVQQQALALRTMHQQFQLLQQRLDEKESQVDQLTKKLESANTTTTTTTTTTTNEEQDDGVEARMGEQFRLLQKRFDEKEAQVDLLTSKLDSLTTVLNKQVMMGNSSSSKHTQFRDEYEQGEVDLDDLTELQKAVVPIDQEARTRGLPKTQTSSSSLTKPSMFNRRAYFRGMSVRVRERSYERRPQQSPEDDIAFIDVDSGLDIEDLKRKSGGGVKRKDDDDTDTEDQRTNLHIHEVFRLPEDVFTMMFFADHCSAAFAYGVFVFGLQILTLTILLTDLTDDDGLPTGEFDRNRLNVPIQVDWQVHIARIIAVLVTVISRDDCLDTFWIVSIGHKRRWQRIFPGATIPDFVMMNIMRFAEGAYTIVISFIVAVQSDNVIDLFLNFAAIEFVANLDNLAYMLAKTGWLTRSMTELTEKIDDETEILLHDRDREKLKRTESIKYVLMIVMLVSLYAGLYRIYSIEQQGLLVKDVSCEKVLVTFGEKKFRFSSVDSRFKGFEITTKTVSNQTIRSIVGSNRPLLGNFDETYPPDVLFSHFSGEYQGYYGQDERLNDRPVYYERGFVDPTAGKFYYCEAEKAWVFTIEAFGSYNAVPEATQDRCDTDGWLIRSPVTDALVLEDAPTEGWKAWTGSFEEMETFQIQCGTCSSNIDCSVNRGTCADKGKCDCDDGFAGTFCEADTPCDYLASYNEGRVKILTSSNYTSNKRPIYVLDLDGDEEEEDRKLDERGDEDDNDNDNSWGRRQNSLRMLLYAGTRWYDVFFAKDDLAVFDIYQGNELLTDTPPQEFEKTFHPYWAGIRIDGTQHISERTEQMTPTGPLVWKSFLESRAEGSYGLYGALKDIVQSFECLSVDCSVENICGKFGECTEVDNIVVFGGTMETGVAGNQCVCTVEQATGHFCEFYNYVDWDENGTITKGPYELDPFQAGCYGPLRNLPDCVEKLYPDFEEED